MTVAIRPPSPASETDQLFSLVARSPAHDLHESLTNSVWDPTGALLHGGFKMRQNYVLLGYFSSHFRRVSG